MLRPSANHYDWFPEDTGFHYTLAPSHQPLGHLRDQFTVLTNLSHTQGRISGHVHPYNWLTILQQLGCPVKSFKESTGPIAELLA